MLYSIFEDVISYYCVDLDGALPTPVKIHSQNSKNGNKFVLPLVIQGHSSSGISSTRPSGTLIVSSQDEKLKYYIFDF